MVFGATFDERKGIRDFSVVYAGMNSESEDTHKENRGDEEETMRAEENACVYDSLKKKTKVRSDWKARSVDIGTFANALGMV
jgi:hypothetical protein